ncbi:hypothetical protein [Pseudobacter ginsenosidimutans]|uniref:Polyketide cyclase/dehydrase/lipid transport protein n=1 Tax=Pseudobacter ginsenosidimutans TaxID=661488 RepID=A0A4Q7MPQ3_9BACT|nr:hypothetical protein [Pseudobacter ginsenosidimutans]QEC42481.1 hypothetical protein FSB84_12540 [Pseudobacter ginsenosidimutans]RZS70666.1 hypothetical protein EV199_2559 [Pseudobacter ginsenosidimutans]
MYRIFLMLMLFTGAKVNAQMTAAQKFHWDADTAAVFSVKSLPVWDLIKETGKWNEISNGYVQSVTVMGDHPNQTRVVKFADGKERKDLVAQYQPEYKMIVLKLAAPLPAGIKEGVMAFYVTNKEAGGSELRITIVVKGEDVPKAALVEELKQEAAAYLKGVSARVSGK